MKIKPRKWTKAEGKKCWQMKNAGKSNREIGRVLNRTDASVHYFVGKTFD